MSELCRYKNKHFSILGDSVSTLDGYTRPDFASYYEGARKLEADVLFVEDTWWGQLVDALGGRLLVNNSIAGSMVTKHRSCIAETYGCSYERIRDLSRDGIKPEVVIVFMGYNDWGCGAVLKDDGEDISVFSNAYRLMLCRIRECYPNAEIWCLTLPINPDKAIWNGRAASDYCEVIREVARAAGCRSLDLNYALESFDTVDGFHPNASGMRAISRALLSLIEEGEK